MIVRTISVGLVHTADNAAKDGNIAAVERELMLVKVRATGKEREEIKRTADIFRARIIDVTDASYVVELTGNQGKLDAFLSAIDPALILETVRSGVCGVGRGDRVLKL